jgi:hypothetical protein
MKKLLLLPLLMITCLSFSQDAKEIIGKPVKIGNLLVAENDFPIGMMWDDANKACRSLGKGWRLPTKNEFNILYKNREKIGGFRDDIYWSSTEYDNSYLWFQRF